jgi:hypothetical protein
MAYIEREFRTRRQFLSVEVTEKAVNKALNEVLICVMGVATIYKDGDLNPDHPACYDYWQDRLVK